MIQLLTAISKELLLLKRDRAGLLLLFVMPALLVIVLTLVQENVMELTGQKKTQVVFLDLDKGLVGNSLSDQLSKGYMELIPWEEKGESAEALRAAVVRGEYQVGVIIEKGVSQALQKGVTEFFQGAEEGTQAYKTAAIPVTVVFDPGIMPSLRTGLHAQLQIALRAIAMEEKIGNMERELKNALERINVPAEHSLFPLEELSSFMKEPLLITTENKESVDKEPYNPVQQNVPAWALFGMFFTALPIAGTLLQERNSGIWIRLTSLPVSFLTLLSGKIVAYTGICLSQFLLISLIGAFVFPLLGLPAFIVSEGLFSLILILLCSSLMACGSGLFLGVFCRTYEQALALGATFIVLAAALGGVMVPVYAMPQIMQRWSLLSPLNWGLNAFHDVSMRGASLFSISDDLGRLCLFFIILLLLTWRRVRCRV